MNLEQITVQDCVDLMEKKEQRVVIEAGQVTEVVAE